MAELVRTARRRKGWSQGFLAGQVMLDKSTIYRIEKGKTMPRGETRRRLAEVLGIPLEALPEPEQHSEMDERYIGGHGSDLLRTLRHAWPELTRAQQFRILQAALDARENNVSGSSPGKTEAS